jgi:5-formyltetrahydrofolate cyclo-ligase
LNDLRADKAALRVAVLARRDALPHTARADLSRRITGALLAQPALATAATVAAYLSFGSEFDTADFVARVLGAGKRLALPRVNREQHRLELHAVHDLDRDLVPGVWGIREPWPERCPLTTLQETDLVLAPGVAFSSRCDRLGYGGGFYDKLLAGRGARPVVIAAAFDVQVVSTLPVGPDDVPVDLVVTESAIYRKSPSRLGDEGRG